MKKLMALVIAVTALAGCVSPQHIKKWEKRDKILLGTLVSLSAIDGLQTNSNIKRLPKGIKEDNNLITSKTSIWVYGISTLYGITFLADRIKPLRTPILLYPIYIEYGIVRKNQRLGMTIKFKY